MPNLPFTADIMADNLISVLARGNLELFHSAFIAWLLDPKASHEFGDAFFRALRPYLKADDFSAGYTVCREFTNRRSRFDIILRPTATIDQPKALVIENKFKSFGSHLQFDSYAAKGYAVAALALLPETLDAETHNRYPVVTYRTIHDILRGLPLNRSNGYHFVVDQYRSFLSWTLAPFELVRDFALGQVSAETFATRFALLTKDGEFGDNDIRTFNYFYYFRFDEYLRQSQADLVFGTADYNQGQNTRWLFEKNMQGQPFMEAIIEEPFSKTSTWRMPEALLPVFKGERFQIAPRIEIWLDPKFLTTPTSHAGELLLGTWSPALIQFLRSCEPYKSTLVPVGKRNFHREPLCVADLPFEKLAYRIRSLLSKIFDHESPEQKDVTAIVSPVKA